MIFYTVHLPIGNQLPSVATLHPRRTDTNTNDAAAEDAALRTEVASEEGLSSDVTFHIIRSKFSYRQGEWLLNRR
jgi:hypothetical protein